MMAHKMLQIVKHVFGLKKKSTLKCSNAMVLMVSTRRNIELVALQLKVMGNILRRTTKSNVLQFTFFLNLNHKCRRLSSLNTEKAVQ